MSRKEQRRLLVVCLVVLDTVGLAAALYLSYRLRDQGFLRPPLLGGGAENYLLVGGLALPFWLLLYAVFRLYAPDRLLGGTEEYAGVLKANTFGVMLLIAVGYLVNPFHPVARGWVILVWLLSMAVMGAARFWFRRLMFRLRRRGWFLERTLVAGVSEHGQAMARQLVASGGCQIVGFLDDYLVAGTSVGDGFHVLGSCAQVEEMAQRHGISQIVVIPNAIAWESFERIVSHAGGAANGYEVKLSPGFYELLTTGVEVTHRGFVPLLTVNRARITGLDAVLKRLLDLSLASVVLLLVSPLMGLVCLLHSGGAPPLHRHRVLGRSGEPFHLLKYRSGPEAPARLERWLYRSGLDKLPQLLNVLTFKMSLVGPRPVPEARATEYAAWLQNLLTVKPGVTGPWVMLKEGASGREEEMRLNLYYIRNWTIWLDLQILFQSALRVLTGSRPKISRTNYCASAKHAEVVADVRESMPAL